MKKILDTIRNIFRKDLQSISYPRTYSDKELKKEIDKYGDQSPNSHLGPSYYARASLGLTELERRDSSALGWSTVVVSFFALIFSAISLIYVARQTQYTELQSRGDRIQQLQNIQRAVEFCKNSPDSEESGLYNASNGKSVSCTEVLENYK